MRQQPSPWHFDEEDPSPPSLSPSHDAINIMLSPSSIVRVCLQAALLYCTVQMQNIKLGFTCVCFILLRLVNSPSARGSRNFHTFIYIAAGLSLLLFALSQLEALGMTVVMELLYIS